MNIVFVSNHFNHHQSALSEALYKATGGQFVFMQTALMSEERRAMGWGIELPSYVKVVGTQRAFRKEAAELINCADIVIAGAAPESLLISRVKKGKLTFRYSERIFKNKEDDLLRWIKYTARELPLRNKNVYYLCSSAYAAWDYIRCGVKPEKCYKWGYFPSTKRYTDINEQINSKKKATILWVARFINWKHPEAVIELAKHLKSYGIPFEINMIGNGKLKDPVQKQIEIERLGDCVFLLGTMTPDEVRTYMEKSEVFVFTSDRNEGWGAVLNEAMNSGCAVVANRAIGAVPFLIKDGKNGLVYDNMVEFCEKTKWLLEHADERREMARQAYYTIIGEWNADNAAERLINSSNSIMGASRDAFQTGEVCSRADVIKA